MGVACTAAGAGANAVADGTAKTVLLGGEERQRRSLWQTGSDERKLAPEVADTAADRHVSTDGRTDVVMQTGGTRDRTSLSLTGTGNWKYKPAMAIGSSRCRCRHGC